MASIDDLENVAEAFLAAALDALALTDAGPPGRAYVSPGEPPMDCCGECVVWTGPLGYADTLLIPPVALEGAKRVRRGGQPVITVNVRATRCGEVLREDKGKIILPEPAALQADAKKVDQDGWALWNHIRSDLQTGDLANVCAGAWMDGGTKLQPQGGCIGWQFVYRYPIDGGRLGT